MKSLFKEKQKQSWSAFAPLENVTTIPAAELVNYAGVTEGAKLLDVGRGEEVEIIQHENEIIIRKIPQNLGKAYSLLKTMPKDFFSEDRIDLPPKNREQHYNREGQE